jgi:hypothetical protein
MFTIQEVTDLQWCDAEHTFFSCNVKYAEFNEVHPTGVNATDPYDHIKLLWARGNAGGYGVIAEYVAPLPDVVEEDVVPAQDQPTTSGTQTL